MKNRYNREAIEKGKRYRMGKREPKRLLKKSIFLPAPNCFGVYRPFFRYHLITPSETSH